MNSALTAAVVGLLAIASSGCGSDGGGGAAGPTSGVTDSKTLATLTPSDEAKLCDWTAATGGGYGKSMTCSDGVTESSHLNQAECVASLIPCDLTVAEYESCVKVVLVLPLCEREDKFNSAPECAPFFECF